jgi:hypothetical protein
MNLNRFIRIFLLVWHTAQCLTGWAATSEERFRFTLKVTGKRAPEERVLYVSREKAHYLEGYTEMFLLVPIDSSGAFSCSVPCKAMETLTLSGNLYQSKLVAEPGGVVQCTISIPDSLSSGFKSKPSLPTHIVAPENGLQAGLEAAEDAVQAFYREHYALFIKPKMLRSKLTELDSNFTAIKSRFDHPGVHAFCRYALAKLYETCGANKAKLERTYLAAPNTKRDLWWRGFFTFHYQNYFSRFQAGQNWKELEDAIQVLHSIEQVRSVVKKLDPTQSNDTLRDILIIKGLFDLRNQKNMKVDAIQQLLRYLRTQGIGDESKQLAKACLEVMIHFEAGERVDCTSIEPKDLDLILQQARKSGMVWWCAFDPDGPEMEREWVLLNKIMVVYNKKIGIVLSPVLLKKNQRFGLPAGLEHGKDASIVPLTNLLQTEQLGISNLPFSSLIELDSDGNLLWYKWSCPMPSQGLETMLKSTFSKQGK